MATAKKSTTTKREEITDKTYVRVYKNIVGSLSYVYSDKERYWKEDDEYRNLEVRSILDMMATVSGRDMFERNLLLIKENKYREYFGLEPIDENVLDYEKIKEILTSKDYVLIEDKLQTCTDKELEIFVDVCYKAKLADYNAVKLVEDYTGLEMLEEIKAMNEGEGASINDVKPETARRGKKKV